MEPVALETLRAFVLREADFKGSSLSTVNLLTVSGPDLDPGNAEKALNMHHASVKEGEFGEGHPRGAQEWGNAFLEKELSQQGFTAPKARKTGTTIAGLVYKDGVLLGADTRATDDMVVADKNCLKIHVIASKIYCCGAGVAADAEMTTQLLSSNLQLHVLSTGREPRVVTACRMLKQMLFRYKGHIGASLIVGGVDCRGPHLYTVHPHGSTDCLPFVSMGSGAGAAMAILEDRFKPNMELKPATDLLRDAITAGIMCDLGSGSNVDLCVITREKVELMRGYDQLGKRGERYGSYRYRQGTTAVLKQSVKPLELELVEEVIKNMDME